MKAITVKEIDQAAERKFGAKIKKQEKRIQILEGQIATLLQKLKHIDTARTTIVEIGEDDSR